MNDRSSVRVRRLGAACAAISALAATVLHADVITATYTSDSQYAYEIIHMPDLDQRRAAASGILGLPGDGGMYCAPTSVLNLAIYASNHGFPEVWPGSGNYQSGSLYNAASLNLLSMGLASGTDAVNGTSGQGWLDGPSWWFSQSAPGKFTVNAYFAAGNYSPTMTSMTKTAIGGSIVAFGYGRYSVIGNYLGFPVLDRDGGHCITLAKATRSGGTMSLYSRDPANPNDGMLLDQSTFGNLMYTAQDQIVTTEFSIAGLKNMTAINYDATKPKNAYIDGYIAVRPKIGYSFKNTGVLTNLAFFQPWKLGGLFTDETTNLTYAGKVNDVIIDPDLTSVLMLVDGGSAADQLVSLDLLTQKATPITALPNAQSLVFGRKRELYALANGILMSMDLTQKDPMVIAIAPPDPCDVLAFDDKKGEVVLLSTGAKKILRYHEGLGGTPAIIDLPTTLPMGGHSTLALNPLDGSMVFATDKSPSIVMVVGDGSVHPIVTEQDLPGMPFPTSLDFDDAGHLFACDGSVLKEYVGGPFGAFRMVPNSPWEKYSAGKTFHVTKSRTNFDAAIMSFPKWRNLDPTATDIGGQFQPDCDTKASDTEYGAGKPGTNGIPHLAGVDPPVLGAVTSIRLDHALPGALPFLVTGLQSASLPFDLGTLWVTPISIIPFPATVNADGIVSLEATLPPDAGLCGIVLYQQVLVKDPGAAGYYHTAQTNGLKRVFGS